jgi:hypothetical protein
MDMRTREKKGCDKIDRKRPKERRGEENARNMIKR